MKFKYAEAWNGFEPGIWQEDINVRDFIQKNYTPYLGDDQFLVGPTKATIKLWDQVMEYKAEEAKRGGVYDAETKLASRITTYGAGYLNKDLEKIVGVQTDAPFKRGLMPFGGVRTAEQALNAYGYELDETTKNVFAKYRKTHNDAVFAVYNKEIRKARHNSIITGLPDAYGRGRIIGDYRRVALYGIDRLIEQKQYEKELYQSPFTPETNLMREEISEQINALKGMKKMAASYGYDISEPAVTAQEAVQWTYFGYLAAIKEQNGAAMSLGRVSTFLDIYFERDFALGRLTESEAQEIMDHFVMKLRMVQFIRTPAYNDVFSGDPTWVTESIGGMSIDGRTLVTKNSYRVLHTLVNLGPAPEPNLTVLWSTRLPENFKKFCAKISIDTSSIQYENDDLMLPKHGDDYGIACCVSAMRIGKDMQFFGARANLAKALLYAINGGVDEVTGEQVSPVYAKITSEVLDYNEVISLYDQMLDWLAHVYCDALNIIHWSHDKYSYESAQMALHDHKITRYFATGIAGLSVVTDSLSAIKYAKVYPIRNEKGIAVDFKVEGEYPMYGNNDDRVDYIAKELVSNFMNKVRRQYHYRDSVPSLSILTITSNVVYGKATGSTPDGRKAGQPFAPGANPMHGRDHSGALASLESVAKLPYGDAQDGISNTFSIVPGALGKKK